MAESTLPICGADSDQIDINCPLEKGPLTIEKEVDIPKQVVSDSLVKCHDFH